ncbi:hypothetical protein CDL15_Pgr000217 [Punica granatum]|uniref:PSI P700 apoprotein A1 n=1 Tax=Punica granatum TaxID=22663 RepID=A0A218Y1W8_PUNGR|nr:hypothetical protein CDL15_Pgr000217 [Punica granatum]
MIIRSPEPEVKILVDRDPIKTSFEEWAKPGHFSRTIAKGPDKNQRLFVFLGNPRPHRHSIFLGPLLAKPPEH